MSQQTLEYTLLNARPDKPLLTGGTGSVDTSSLNVALPPTYEDRLFVFVDDLPQSIHGDFISLYQSIARAHDIDLQSLVPQDDDLDNLRRDTRPIRSTVESAFDRPVTAALAAGASLARRVNPTLPQNGSAPEWIDHQSREPEKETRSDYIVHQGPGGRAILSVELKNPWAGEKHIFNIVEEARRKGALRASEFSDDSHTIVQKIALAILETSDAPESIEFALLSDTHRFLIFAIYEVDGRQCVLLSPALDQDRLSPSIVSVTTYVLLRPADRTIPLSNTSKTMVHRYLDEFSAVKEEGEKGAEDGATGGEREGGGADEDKEGDGGGNEGGAGGVGGNDDGDNTEQDESPSKRRKIEGAGEEDGSSGQVFRAYAAGGAVASTAALQEIAFFTVFVSPKLAGSPSSDEWPSPEESQTRPSYNIYAHTLHRTLPSSPPYPPAPTSSPPTSPSRRTLCPRPNPPPSPLTLPLLPIQATSKAGRHGRSHFGRVGSGDIVVLKYGDAQVEHEARAYEEVLTGIEGLSVPKLLGVFLGRMFRREEVVLVFEYGGEQLRSWDELSSAQKNQLHATYKLLHAHHIYHHDFAERNVLLSSPDANPLLIDFAISDLNHQCEGEEKCGELKKVRKELAL